MELTEDQLQQLIDQAVEKRAATIREELQQALDVQQEHEKSAQLSMAVNEGKHLHVDPGNGYEFALIHVDKITYNTLSKRTEDELSPDDIGIKKLAKDIQVRGGLTRPLLVYRKDDAYVLVKGARRLAALRSLGEELTYAYILPAKPPIGMEERWVNGY